MRTRHHKVMRDVDLAQVDDRCIRLRSGGRGRRRQHIETRRILLRLGNRDRATGGREENGGDQQAI